MRRRSPDIWRDERTADLELLGLAGVLEAEEAEEVHLTVALGVHRALPQGEELRVADRGHLHTGRRS